MFPFHIGLKAVQIAAPDMRKPPLSSDHLMEIPELYEYPTENLCSSIQCRYWPHRFINSPRKIPPPRLLNTINTKKHSNLTLQFYIFRSEGWV